METIVRLLKKYGYDLLTWLGILKSRTEYLEIPKKIFQEMSQRANAAAPAETGGFLGGRGLRVLKCYTLTNTHRWPTRFFKMGVFERICLALDMLKNGLKPLAGWHSHPTALAIMSKQDLKKAASSDLVEVIVSLISERPIVRAYEAVNGTAKKVRLKRY